VNHELERLKAEIGASSTPAPELEGGDAAH
jgi:hypothetical protein